MYFNFKVLYFKGHIKTAGGESREWRKNLQTHIWQNLCKCLSWILHKDGTGGGCGLISKSYLTLCDPMDCKPPGSSVHGISQAIILGWIAVSFSRESFQPRGWNWVSCLLHCRQILYWPSHYGIPAELSKILKDDAVKVLHSICQQIWKTQQWPRGWKSSVFIPIPKKANAKECSNYRTIALISHASKVMLKILQARFQQYMNCELLDVPAGFRKGRRTRNQIVDICWIIEKVRDFQKNIYFCFIDYAKAFDCVDHNKLWKILKEMGIPDQLTCL